MPLVTPEHCLKRLRVLYADAFKIHTFDDHSVILWANNPELWAEHQIRHRGWSFYAAEAVVRQCRSLRKRAALAAGITPPISTGTDPFDPLMPAVEPSA